MLHAMKRVWHRRPRSAARLRARELPRRTRVSRRHGGGRELRTRQPPAPHGGDTATRSSAGTHHGELDLLYDVSHNLAKLERHEIEGRATAVCVHRKGATRALPPEHPDLPPDLLDTGQPVLIPGSMGTASYVLAGVETGGAFHSDVSRGRPHHEPPRRPQAHPRPGAVRRARSSRDPGPVALTVARSQRRRRSPTRTSTTS